MKRKEEYVLLVSISPPSLQEYNLEDPTLNSAITKGT